jgi:crossover junction endodeoxyribonuclease RuvC
MTKFIGIDPGTHGGIAVIDLSGQVEYLRKMPETEVDIWQLIDEISMEASRAAIEKVHSRPVFTPGKPCPLCHRPPNFNPGMKSSFAFGQNYGFLRACLTATEVRFQTVDPKIWQRDVGIIPKQKGETNTHWKNRLKAHAQQLFPHVNITLATADALLIAEFCRMHYNVTTSRKQNH